MVLSEKHVFINTNSVNAINNMPKVIIFDPTIYGYICVCCINILDLLLASPQFLSENGVILMLLNFAIAMGIFILNEMV